MAARSFFGGAPSGKVQARGGYQLGGLPSPIQTGTLTRFGSVHGRSNLVIGGTDITGGGGGIPIPGTGVEIGVPDILNIIDRIRGGGRDKPGSSAPTTSGLVPNQPASNCPPGTFRLPGVGTCVDLVPGGSTSGAGMVVTPGEAVQGAFGLPAFMPAIVGQLADGGVIRRCPRRTVLGMDDKCYVKGTIPRQFRKWPPDAKPPVSAYDARMMRTYGRGGSKAKAAARLAQQAGYSTKQK